jgi:hypothetical protein
MVQQLLAQILKQHLLATVLRLVPRTRGPVGLVEREGDRTPFAGTAGRRGSLGTPDLGRVHEGGVALHPDEGFGASGELCG